MKAHEAGALPKTPLESNSRVTGSGYRRILLDGLQSDFHGTHTAAQHRSNLAANSPESLFQDACQAIIGYLDARHPPPARSAHEPGEILRRFRFPARLEEGNQRRDRLLHRPHVWIPATCVLGDLAGRGPAIVLEPNCIRSLLSRLEGSPREPLPSGPPHGLRERQRTGQVPPLRGQGPARFIPAEPVLDPIDRGILPGNGNHYRIPDLRGDFGFAGIVEDGCIGALGHPPHDEALGFLIAHDPVYGEPFEGLPRLPGDSGRFGRGLRSVRKISSARRLA